MAGIGFELLNLWKHGSYRSMLTAYSFTALIGAGPGLFIISSLGIICFFASLTTANSLLGYQFLSIATHLLATSMILSALFQYSFFRFMANKIFAHEFDQITPNFIGALFIQLCFSVFISVPLVFYFFLEQSLSMKILLISSFNILCMIWLSIVLLSGLKAYRFIIWGFALGYYCMIVVYFLWARNDLIALLFGFLLAQVIILGFLFYAILDYYPTSDCIKFDFLKKENLYFTLVFSNFFYALGFWIDKFLFWYHPNTGFLIYPPLRLSPLYDLPMFIAYIVAIPATAIFLFHIEADFALIYPRYMRTIFQRKSLSEIDAVRNELILSGRASVFSLFKAQSAMLIVAFLSMNYIFQQLQILPIYLNLLFILLVSVGLNIILFGLLNILYYMTQNTHALIVSVVFAVGNFTFTLISLYAGPNYYGYGLGFGSLIAIACALFFLNHNFKNLEFTTFMMVD
ncbi:MAG: exopolysaccharide Pel transporter PelG [Legionella sp.]|uniref:exopolysaccharide Pel transporter PelG n=1 Tax=Legionella sp. TaxID=459 RepID=UPI00283ECA31|nr:exopolysaccharide Pel transporter PelG [Legionella sp.]